jgi:class 3 adenylate cyclase
MSEIRTWLQAIGLAQYAETFAANEIDLDLLAQVDDQILKDIGISIAGHRMRIRAAIARLGPETRSDAVGEGAPVVPAPAAAPERRQLTVMFCDLVGSTAMSARLDPEDMREVIRTYQDACSGVIARYDGFLAKFMGDGILAYFGFPRAHEDDAERAIRAGLDIVATVGRLRTPSDEPLQVRLGIATGLVVVGDLIGEGSSQEQAVVGDTPNLAARLQALAEPDTIVIAASTRRLIGDQFELRGLGAHLVKGLADPVEAWAVERLSATESRFGRGSVPGRCGARPRLPGNQHRSPSRRLHALDGGRLRRRSAAPRAGNRRLRSGPGSRARRPLRPGPRRRRHGVSRARAPAAWGDRSRDTVDR